MMRRSRLLPALGVSFILAAVLPAGDVLRDPGSRPLRLARSDNREFQLRIEAGREGVAPCRASLLEHRRRAPVWQVELVNEVAPEYAFVRDDGAWVVTLNEHRVGGAAHAAVVYDARGQIKAEFELEELLPPELRRHVSADGPALRWLERARTRWVATPPAFDIILSGGAVIRIELERGVSERLAVAPDDAFLAVDPADAAAPPASLLEQLAELLDTVADPNAASADPNGAGRGPSPDTLLAQLQVAEATDEVQLVIEQLLIEHTRQVLMDTQPERLAAVLADARPEFDAGAWLTDTWAGNSWTQGVPVPRPDPREPVDYVAWYNDVRHQDGLNAAGLLTAARETFLPWEGAPELYDAALAGDPTALADPDLQAWLADNQEALDHFAAARGSDYYTVDYHSGDGSMIGVLLPDLSELRNLTRAAAIDARHALANGDPDTALQRSLDIIANGRLTSGGGTLIHHLVGVAMQQVGHDVLGDMISNDAAGALDYAAIAQQVETVHQPLTGMNQTIQFERAMALDTVQRLYRADPDTGDLSFDFPRAAEVFSMSDGDAVPNVLWAFAAANAGFDDSIDQINRYYDELTVSLNHGYPQAAVAMQSLEQRLAPDGEFNNPMLQQLVPALSRAHQLTTRSETNRQASRLIAQLHAFRQTTGAFPDNLDLLGHESAIDPFSGAPFAYRRNGDTFELYSISADGLDDGGVHQADLRGGDLRYWPPPEQ